VGRTTSNQNTFIDDSNTTMKRAVVAVIVWKLDLQLPMQYVLIIIDVVSLNLDQGEVYIIM
jgi:hypothetical protein